MIDIGKILKRSWHILWNYRILWIFGLLLAMTGGSSSGQGIRYSFGGSNSSTSDKNFYPNYQDRPEMRAFLDWVNQNITPLFTHPDKFIATIIWIVVGMVLFFLIVGIVLTFVRYVSEASLLRTVDEYEQTGAKVGFKLGWKLGWSRRAFLMWWIDFLLGLPAFFVVLLLGGLGVLIFFSVQNPHAGLAVGSTVASIACASLLILAIFLGTVFLSLLRQFFVRAAVLEGLGTRDAFRQGWATFKNNWKSAVLMWLVMLGIGIGFGIAGMILFFLLAPVYIVLLLPAALVAAIPGLIGFGITSIFSSGVLAWIIGILVAIPFFFTILFAPLTLINGWYLIFNANVWTLTYREMKALEGLKPEESPAPTPAA